MSAVTAWTSDVLVLFGVVVMTIGVYGVVRMPGTYLKLHAASKMIALGTLPLLVASALAGAEGLALRAVPIAVFLLLTTPVSSHLVARAAYLRGERTDERSQSLDPR